jgi:hypothetical protein
MGLNYAGLIIGRYFVFRTSLPFEKKKLTDEVCILEIIEFFQELCTEDKNICN